MASKHHSKTVQTNATIKKGKSLILRENQPTQIFIASKLGVFSGTLIDQLFYANNIIPFMPKRAPLKYCRILSCDITSIASQKTKASSFHLEAESQVEFEKGPPHSKVAKREFAWNAQKEKLGFSAPT
ncbi:hypothetical protein TNCV_3035821 [Trichonephila clavipes]|nr:hypothetical protein TNCV_3035821 [Trichonephila clavipes]